MCGIKRSNETKKRMSIGQKTLHHNRSHSEETKRKIGKATKKFHGGKNEIVGTPVYWKVHRWIKKQLGQPDKCERCKRIGLTGHKIHWANKSQEYKFDVQDWIRLCASCHNKYDVLYKHGQYISKSL